MSIDYIYILDAQRIPLGIIDTAESIIWQRDYYGTGIVEVYTAATSDTVGWLTVGNYIYRGDNGDAAIIESIKITYDAAGGVMITAGGRNIKSILDRRLIIQFTGPNSITPTVISGNLEAAVRGLVKDHIIDAAQSFRNVDFIELGAVAGLPDVIVGENGQPSKKQTSYSNLLAYTDGLLESYHIGARLTLNPYTGKMLYTVYKGADRSRGNTEGNDPIIFSQEYDNLIASIYEMSAANYKSVAFIGGAGEGSERYFESTDNGDTTGFTRSEIFIDASSQSRTYESGGVQQQYSDADYSEMLITAGIQKLNNDYRKTESFSGGVDLATTNYQLYDDVDLGDVVTVEDAQIGVYINARIVQTTEVQDDGGYSAKVTFGL